MTEGFLPYHIAGRADRPAILLVHPLGADLSFWAAVQNLLKDEYQVIACSLRGARGSLYSSIPITLQQTAKDIEAIRSHLGLASMVIAGCAIGAMAAATYAALYSHRVIALILSNPAAEITPLASEILRNRAFAVQERGMKTLLPEAIDRAFYGCNSGPLREVYERNFLAQPAQGYAMAAIGACGTTLRPVLGGLTMPVLLVAGGRDLLLPPTHAEFLRASLKQSRMLVVSDGAHFIPYQRPNAFAIHLGEFLNPLVL